MRKKPPDAYRQKRVPQLRPWSPVASVDAYSKVVRYDRIIAETVKRGLAKNDHVRCKSLPAQRKEDEMETVDFIVCICCTIVGMYVGFRIGRVWKD